jgi:alkanesulfonate monooxygenase SsuD/methylene tetrahydromethanopterin reductase-like flavin-dependent oxidoreductase (luciferase family)
VQELMGQTPPLAGTLDEVAERLREYEAVGVERAMLQHLDHDDVEMVALLGELASHLL